MLLYFQVYSNSAYPQHSGERYRTNGPLVLPFLPFYADSSAEKFGLESFVLDSSMFRLTRVNGSDQID